MEFRCIHVEFYPRILVFVREDFHVHVEIGMGLTGIQVESAEASNFHDAVEKANTILVKHGRDAIDGSCGLTKEEQETIELLQ